MIKRLHQILQNVRHKHPIDYIAGINSGISAVALYPQLFDMLANKPVAGLSPTTFFLIALSSCIWFAYGMHRRTPPLVISSACNGFAASMILLMIITRN